MNASEARFGTADRVFRKRYRRTEYMQPHNRLQLAAVDRNDDFRKLWVKVRACAPFNFFKRSGHRTRASIGPIGGHRIKCVSDGNESTE